MEIPLSERIRPDSFEGFFGQEDLSSLKKVIASGNIFSVILWGPPGSGKTTLARIIAKKAKRSFKEFSASIAKIAEIRKFIENNKGAIIFVDEIHRFNKSQQGIFLPHIENGDIILVGATTENPSFNIISPLLSRSTVYTLSSLPKEALKKIILKALFDKKKGLAGNFSITNKALEKLINYSDGDARVALNGLEFTANYLAKDKKITEKKIEGALKKHALRYDKHGEEHYNIISAFIKSMRDSDPDGALYWLARMIKSGEDPRFIARRMIIFASEDIGNADCNALNVAVSVSRAVEYVGMPETQINLAQGTTYLSMAPKSNSSYKALLLALKDAEKGAFGVPLHLRNAPTSLMKELDYGKDYKYAHDYGKVEQSHFPKEVGKKRYYYEKRR